MGYTSNDSLPKFRGYFVALPLVGCEFAPKLKSDKIPVPPTRWSGRRSGPKVERFEAPSSEKIRLSKNCQVRLSSAPNRLTISHYLSFIRAIRRGNAANIIIHHTHSPPTTTASLHTVFTALLQLQHNAIATNHRFGLVKCVRPAALSRHLLPDSPSPPPPPDRPTGAVLV